MGKYDHLSKEELIQRIERLEADLEKATLTPSASDNELEMRQSQHTINFLNILMDTILSNVFVEITVKDIFNGFRYIYFNKAAEEFTGVKAEDILGKTDFELFPDSRRAHEIRTEDYHTIKTGRMVKKMVEYEKPNGEVRIVNIVRLLITNPDPGASPLLLVMLNDITEQRQDQLALMKVQEADKMKNAFIANMSHEIRTPLNAIVGFAHLVTETTNASEQREYFSIINKNCDLLLKLINDILDLSKIESGRLNYNVSEVELRDICQEAYVVQSLKMTSDVALLYNSVAMPSVHLWIDPHRVEQVLLNLLSNAIKFTSKGFISLFYEVEDMFVRVSVMDTGIGIPEDKLESVFERFVKLDDFYQGVGLGLPICKMIVEQLGGEIGVRSVPLSGSPYHWLSRIRLLWGGVILLFKMNVNYLNKKEMKNAVVFLATGFEEIEALGTIDVLRRGGVRVMMVSIMGDRLVIGAHDIPVMADYLFEEADFSCVDALILPGGIPGSNHLNAHAHLKELVKEKTEEGVLIGAICAGPMVLGGLGLLKGKRATCFPFFEPTMVGATPTDNGVEQDGNIITSKGPGFMFEFGLTILRNLKDEEIALEVADALLYDALLHEAKH